MTLVRLTAKAKPFQVPEQSLEVPIHATNRPGGLAMPIGVRHHNNARDPRQATPTRESWRADPAGNRRAHRLRTHAGNPEIIQYFDARGGCFFGSTMLIDRAADQTH